MPADLHLDVGVDRLRHDIGQDDGRRRGVGGAGGGQGRCRRRGRQPVLRRRGRDVGSAAFVLLLLLLTAKFVLGGFVLVDEVDPAAGEELEPLRIGKAALVGARHVVARLVLEGQPLGERAFALRRPDGRIGGQPPVDDGTRRFEIGCRHQLLRPAEIVHQSSPRFVKICRL